MIEEKKIEIDGKEFVISKLPATVAREILYKYTAAGKNILTSGDYAISEEVMLKLMSYVGIYIDGRLIQFTSEDVINNHIKSVKTLLIIEKEMAAYNYDFFTIEKISAFLKKWRGVAEEKGIEMLTVLSQKLSQAGKQH